MTNELSAAEAAQSIGAARLLPVLRTRNAGDARDLGLHLLGLGITALELTTTIPGWEHLLPELQSAAPQALIGIGTVGSDEQAERGISAGAHFLVSPYPVAAARAVAASTDTLFIEGGFTPLELASSSARGLAKLFPAHVGGPSYLKSALAVLPEARIIPTGGIPISDVPMWLEAGAFAVGVGSDLYTGDIETKTLGLLRTLQAIG